MSSRDYASTPKIHIDIRQKSDIQLDETLVKYVDFDLLVGEYDDQGQPDSGSLDPSIPNLGGIDAGGGGVDPGSGGGTGGGNGGTVIVGIPQFIPGSVVQTSRVVQDGSTVVDVTFQVTDIYGASKYEIRVST